MRRRKNTSIQNKTLLWYGVITAIVGLASVSANISALGKMQTAGKGVGGTVLPGGNNRPGIAGPVHMPPIPAAAAGTLLPKQAASTAQVVQEGTNHAISMVRPSVVAVFASARALSKETTGELAPIESFGSGSTKVGSGTIIHPQGYILSTMQTVGTAKEVTVTIFGGNKRQYPADVISSHPDANVVLLKIRHAGPFPSAMLGNSDTVETGDLVFAMGSPFGFSKTVTMGIVGTRQRQLTIAGAAMNMIQTDASLNTGDDGGPLVNLRGEVIGINAVHYIPGNHYTGIGFAIPVNSIKQYITL